MLLVVPAGSTVGTEMSFFLALMDSYEVGGWFHSYHMIYYHLFLLDYPWGLLGSGYGSAV